MRTGDLLLAASQFLFISAVLVLGATLFTAGLVPPLYHKCVAILFQEGPSFLMLAGGLLLLVGIALFFLLCFLYRGMFYEIKLPSATVCVTSALIEERIGLYLSSLSLPYSLECKVANLQAKKIVLAITHAHLAKQEREELFTRLQGDLPALLQKELGYNSPLILSFRSLSS